VAKANGCLVDLKRPLQLHPASFQVPKVLQHETEVVTPDGHVRVGGANGRLTDRQRPLKLLPGALRIPKDPQHEAKVAAAGGDVRIVGANGRLVDIIEFRGLG
jgi:hypothetical protein